MATERQEASASDLKSSCVKQPLPGGFEPIKDIGDPKIQRLGEFAVDEHNKSPGSHYLKFEEVIGGSFQIVAGIIYVIQLTAFDKVISRIYGAIVYEDLNNNLHLNEFFPITRD